MSDAQRPLKGGMLKSPVDVKSCWLSGIDISEFLFIPTNDFKIVLQIYELLEQRQKQITIDNHGDKDFFLKSRRLDRRTK